MGFYDKYIRMSCRGMSARLPNTHAHIHTLMDCVPVGILWSVRSEQKWLSAHKSKCSRRNKKQHQRIVKLLLTSEGIWMLFDICNWFSANQWYSRLCWWSKVWTQFFFPLESLCLHWKLQFPEEKNNFQCIQEHLSWVQGKSMK